MTMASCVTPSGLPAPDKADTDAVKPVQCPPSLLTDLGPIPAKPKGATILAPDPYTAEAQATEAFLQWVQSVVAHAVQGDKRAADIKAFCAAR